MRALNLNHTTHTNLMGLLAMLWALWWILVSMPKQIHPGSPWHIHLSKESSFEGYNLFFPPPVGANPTGEAADRRAPGEAASSIAPHQLYTNAACTYLRVLTKSQHPGRNERCLHTHTHRKPFTQWYVWLAILTPTKYLMKVTCEFVANPSWAVWQGC